jgi:DNA-binding transcriptional MerR regulator
MSEATHLSDNEYLGISEAAEYLRVSASTLRRWEKKGFLIPERTPTGIRRYTKTQLDAVMQTPYGETPRHGYADVAIPEVLDHTEKPPMHANVVSGSTVVDETVTEPHLEAQKSINSMVENITAVEPTQVEELHQEEHFSAVLPETSQASSSEEEFIPPQRHEISKPTFDHPTFVSDDTSPEIDPFANMHTSSPLVPPQNPLIHNDLQSGTKYDHMFHVEHTVVSDDEYPDSDLDEYDMDAAAIQNTHTNPDSRASHPDSFKVYAPMQENTSVFSQKRFAFPKKTILILVSSLIVIVIIVFGIYLATSQLSPAGAPLNPVIE